MRITFRSDSSETSSKPTAVETDLVLDLQRLGGPDLELPLGCAEFVGEQESVKTFRNHAMRGLLLTASVSNRPVRSVALGIYQQLFGLLGDNSLYRVWNYVPRINEGEGDSENYRQFCLGRSEAFRAHFGESDIRFMPAGTCVGCQGDTLVIVALAGPTQPEHHENPNQLPAYQYPREYGPRSPSFARASSVVIADQRYRFISGTAAVVGHESRGASDLEEQLTITADNIDTIVRETLASPQSTARPANSTLVTGKVYLRHASDFERAQQYIEARFPDAAGRLTYLESDICRRELLLEIELGFLDQLA